MSSFRDIILSINPSLEFVNPRPASSHPVSSRSADPRSVGPRSDGSRPADSGSHHASSHPDNSQPGNSYHRNLQPASSPQVASHSSTKDDDTSIISNSLTTDHHATVNAELASFQDEHTDSSGYSTQSDTEFSKSDEEATDDDGESTESEDDEIQSSRPTKRMQFQLAMNYQQCNDNSKKVRDRDIGAIGDDWKRDGEVFQDITQWWGHHRPVHSPCSGGIGLHKFASSAHPRNTLVDKMARDCSSNFLEAWKQLSSLTRGNRDEGVNLAIKKANERQAEGSRNSYKNVPEVMLGDIVKAVDELNGRTTTPTKKRAQKTFAVRKASGRDSKGQ
ncbi:uncharacterized protein K452DRAFT_344003 [Aplosporella prunicola CBS 121167]|uniref:Uncharacterized protein n=1 Tax=Aplosporella prunicola CBS 121167 TaxID=1176127 RepID=A0A6A6AZX7_9PEZI|nr:uncharacterized protein K452DRAFT_344003 [Aplosporella prunicola CBS 121167]KAF2136327.1 hypothetical protein K452DRAFT_344003 [Aplosporella prunicola CBS 121167]